VREKAEMSDDFLRRKFFWFLVFGFCIPIHRKAPSSTQNGRKEFVASKPFWHFSV
jgi:hypothetical protein